MVIRAHLLGGAPSPKRCDISKRNAKPAGRKWGFSTHVLPVEAGFSEPKARSTNSVQRHRFSQGEGFETTRRENEVITITALASELFPKLVSIKTGPLFYVPPSGVWFLNLCTFATSATRTAFSVDSQFYEGDLEG